MAQYGHTRIGRSLLSHLRRRRSRSAERPQYAASQAAQGAETMLKSAIATKLKWGYCCKSWETFASKRGHDDGILLATMDLDVDVGK